MRFDLSLTFWLAMVAFFGCHKPAGPIKESKPEPTEEIKLTRIKAADVEKAIADHRGKVVVLDVWGEF